MKKNVNTILQMFESAKMAETYTHTHTHTLLDSVAEQKNPRRPESDDAGCVYMLITTP